MNPILAEVSLTGPRHLAGLKQVQDDPRACFSLNYVQDDNFLVLRITYDA